MKLRCKTTSVFPKNNFSHSSSISTGHMSYRTQKIWDLSFHSCNNNISLLSTGTRACGLMGLSLARPSSGEESVTITVSANQSFCYSKFEIQ